MLSEGSREAEQGLLCCVRFAGIEAHAELAGVRFILHRLKILHNETNIYIML